MMHYRFVLQADGTLVEELGFMALRDDGEAVAFGEQIARDLANGLDQQSGAAIAITKRARTVHRIPVQSRPLSSDSRSCSFK
jgi:hypothetical protein